MRLIIGGNDTREVSSWWLIVPPFVVGIFCPVIFGYFFVKVRLGLGPFWDPATASSSGTTAGIGVAAAFSLLLIACLAGISTAGLILVQWAGPKQALRYAAVGVVLYLTALWVAIGGSPPLIVDMGEDTFCATVGLHLSGRIDHAASIGPIGPDGSTAAVKGRTPAQDTALSAYRAARANCENAGTPAASEAAQAEADDMLHHLLQAIHWSAVVAVAVIVSITIAVLPLSELPEKPIFDPNVDYGPPDPANPNAPRQLTAAAKAVLNDRIHDLALRMRSMKFLAFAAAAGLVSGVAFLKAWVDWPAALWQGVDKTTDKASAAIIDGYQAAATSFVSFQSLFYALILLASFGPLALLLTKYGRELARLDPTLSDNPQERATWLTSHGVALTTSEQIQRALLFVSPLLAGPVADLVKQLVGLMGH